MDAITLLKHDHQAVEKLFKKFEKTGDRAYVERRNLVDQIIEELSKHAAIEEQLFYPVTRQTVPETEDIALESLEEHHIVKWLLSELDGMDPEDERFKPKVTVLIENVRHHVEEEESDYFPKVRAELGRNDLADLGEAMEKAKAGAPTHPHPKAPDVPPGNLLVGTAAGVVDRVGDVVSGVAQGGVAVAQDLVNKILGNPKRHAAPTGSPSTKKTAAKVRSTTTEAAAKARTTGKATTTSATRGVRATARAGTSAARSTGKAARSGAKRTVTTGSKAAKSTRRVAKTSAKS